MNTTCLMCCRACSRRVGSTAVGPGPGPPLGAGVEVAGGSVGVWVVVLAAAWPHAAARRPATVSAAITRPGLRVAEVRRLAAVIGRRAYLPVNVVGRFS